MSRQPDIIQQVIANIEYYRVLNGFTPRDLYGRAQFPKSTYYDRMSRRKQSTFDLHELSKIARALKVTVADLVKGGPA